MASASAEMPGKSWPNTNISGKPKLAVLRLEHAEEPSLPKNPFLIYKSVQQIAGTIEQAILDNGGARYTLKVSNPDQVKALLQMTQLNDGTPVVVTEHVDNNVTHCVVKCRELIDDTEEQLLEAVTKQGVIGVRRITRKSAGGLQEKTSRIVLTFSGSTVPKYVYFSYLRLKTYPYYPQLIQCFKCWQFWHIKSNCSCDPICGTCSGPHDTADGELCTGKPYCKNCKTDEHPISSRKCPKYVTERKIARIKIDRDIPYKDAKKAYERENVLFVDGLLKQVSELKLAMKTKDHEIKVLRKIFDTMQQVRNLKSEVQPTATQKAQPTKKTTPKAAVIKSKAETKHTQPLIKDQPCCPTADDSKTTAKPAGRSGKKRRGKAKK